MARLLVEWAQQGGIGAVPEGELSFLRCSQEIKLIGVDARLTDILTSSNISSLLAQKPALIQTLRPLLPSELNLSEDVTAQDLIPILTAPQFTDAIASLDSALRNGGLPGGMMRELGLPESAGRGVKEFLEGLKGLGGGNAGEERMDED
jgi:26S proteasome regulatory subunit N13